MEKERIGIPRIGDVITCAAFENGWRRKDESQRPIWVTDHDPPQANEYREHVRDASRETAQFVVEESAPSDEDRVTWKERRNSGYGGIHEWYEECSGRAQRIVARRLWPDDTYNPDGELIRFNIWGRGAGDVDSRAVREVLRAGNEDHRRYAIMGVPILKLRAMRRIIRFE